ncbi:homeobox-leucine zipper protein HOX19-like, partial [Phalaenopsis equestris]|uniref:homeobox-leucine zipper protein HOX19-like n=1 Tax=Phalaenopsis equestris TaxID=78828 RepID=UPI0009E457A5
MGVVDDPSESGLLLLRLGRAGQTATPANRRRLRRDPTTTSQPSVLSSSAVSGPSLSLGFSNCEVLVKNEAEGGGSDVEEGGSGGCRKKLRLTREQSAVLEDRFNEHSTLLNPKQKLALAKQLNLRPRQVEVWFQNRRARTKLKKTEVDCEFLRRRCETLAEENRRLHGELQELRSLKLAAVTPL